MFRQFTFSLLAAAAIGITSLITTASATATTGSASTCVDGTVRSNIKYVWDGHDTITVSTKDGKAVCKDTTLFFSAYVMPDTWDGDGFNETAVPQTLHKSVSVTFKAGEAKPSKKLVVPMPHECKNVQTDLYLAPEQTQVTWTDRIGDRLIAAKHLAGMGECQRETPFRDAPKKEEPKQEILSTTAPAPAEIAKTGMAATLSAISAAVTAAGAYVAVYRARK